MAKLLFHSWLVLPTCWHRRQSGRSPFTIYHDSTLTAWHTCRTYFPKVFQQSNARSIQQSLLIGDHDHRPRRRMRCLNIERGWWIFQGLKSCGCPNRGGRISYPGKHTRDVLTQHFVFLTLWVVSNKYYSQRVSFCTNKGKHCKRTITARRLPDTGYHDLFCLLKIVVLQSFNGNLKLVSRRRVVSMNPCSWRDIFTIIYACGDMLTHRPFPHKSA